MMSVPKEKHWGEFEDSNDDPWGDHSFTLSDYEELLVPQMYPPSSTSLHQPSQQLTSSFQILSGESTRSDVTVQNTIRLLQHTRHVSHLINRAQSLSASSNNSGGSNGAPDPPPSTLPPCPPMPAEIPLPRTPLGFQNLNFLPPQSTVFTSGEESGLNLEVEHSTARKMLRQAVALVLVHAGFTETTETVLRTLTDLLHEFMGRFTRLYRNNVDNSILLLNYCSFHDVLEQTMQQLNLGGFLDLHAMYKDRVQTYHANVKSNALHLNNHYNALLNKQQQPQPHMLWQSSSSSSNTNGSSSGVAPSNISTTLVSGSNGSFSQVFPTAGGGSINITIGALPGTSTLNNYPNLTASNSLDDLSSSTSVEAAGMARTITPSTTPRSNDPNSSVEAAGRVRTITSSTPTRGNISNINPTNRSTINNTTSTAAAVGRVVTGPRAANGVGSSSGSGGTASGAPGATAANISSSGGGGIINLEQELSRHYTSFVSGDTDARSQNSPLATHFTINPR